MELDFLTVNRFYFSEKCAAAGLPLDSIVANVHSVEATTHFLEGTTIAAGNRSGAPSQQQQQPWLRRLLLLFVVGHRGRNTVSQ